MNVVELKRDNLADYMQEKELIVVYSAKECGHCVRLKPYLYELPDKFKVVIVDAEKQWKSVNFYPQKIIGYPTIAYFLNGYFNRELKQTEIINEKLKNI